MNTAKLYHKEVFWPLGKLTRWQGKTLRLSFSRHAIKECLKDRYGTIIPPANITFDEQKAFEIELANNLINKVAIRVPYNQTHDISFVLILDGEDSAFVKTLWLNDKTDKHGTLNASLYATA